MIYFIFLFTKEEHFSSLFLTISMNRKFTWNKTIFFKKLNYKRYIFSIWFTSSMFSLFFDSTLLNYLLLFFLIYFSFQVNILYLPLLKHILSITSASLPCTTCQQSTSSTLIYDTCQDHDCLKRRSLVALINGDALCLSRTFVLAEWHTTLILEKTDKRSRHLPINVILP